MKNNTKQAAGQILKKEAVTKWIKEHKRICIVVAVIAVVAVVLAIVVEMFNNSAQNSGVEEETTITVTTISASNNDIETSSNDVATATPTETSAETSTEPPTEKATETSTKTTTAQSPETSTDKSTSPTEAESETKTETEPAPESPSADVGESKTEETTKAQSTEGQKETTKAQTTSKATSGATSPTTTAAPVPVSLKASVTGTHYAGDTLTGADFNLLLTLSDTTTITNPSGFTATPLTLVAGENKITVSYEGVTTEIILSVTERPTTTQAPETVAPTTAAPTTAAPTTTAPTTVAPTTVAATEETSDPTYNPNYWVNQFQDGTFNKELGLKLFEIENQWRAEEGVDLLIWSDDMYEIAKKCAKICADKEDIDHWATLECRLYDYIDTDGYEQQEVIAENLSVGGAPDWYTLDQLAEYYAKAIKDSRGHYETATGDNYGDPIYAAVAPYRQGDALYISYIFWYLPEDFDHLK